MPAEESTPAIVLRARDYAESDRIVTLLTRDFGKLSGIAKGARPRADASSASSSRSRT